MSEQAGDGVTSRLRALVRDIHDFPKPGIVFKDWTPILGSASGLRDAAQGMAEPFRDAGVELVLGTEARGFLLGVPVALELGAGFVPVRKQGKLPYETFGVTYELEYGTDTVEMHTDAILSGQRVLVLDDLLATGGTAGATVELARKAGAEVLACAFLIELGFLAGRARLGVDHVHSVLHY